MPVLEIRARGFIRQTDAGKHYLEVDNEKWWETEQHRFVPDTAVVISVKKWYKKRTLKQNNLYHMYADILADYFGYPLDTMKLLIQLKWLKIPLLKDDGTEMIDITTGEVMFELRSSADLNSYEMGELCDELRKWALDGWGVVLPEPLQQETINFK